MEKGETDLNTLLASMDPQLSEQLYVFISIENGQYGEGAVLKPIAMFAETEGMSLVIPIEKAREQGYSITSSFRRITFNVHSSLEAVGLTASVSQALASQGLSANIIAAYYHDHVFVKAEHANTALSVLKRLASGQSDD